MLEFGKHFTPRCGDEPRSYTCRELQVLAQKEPYDQRVKSMVSGRVPADHELLSLVDPMLLPQAAALSRFIGAVVSFGDHALQAMFLHKLEDVFCRPMVDH